MALHPYSAGGGYVNMMMDEGEDNMQAAYRDNYVRLAQTKARYDPGNLFHVNQNIKPKGELMNATEARNIQVVRTYYDGCNSGDTDLLMSTFAPEVTHYFLLASFPPITGAEAPAQYWRWWKENLDPVWAHDHVIALGDEVVSEWSCIFTPPGNSKRLINR